MKILIFLAAAVAILTLIEGFRFNRIGRKCDDAAIKKALKMNVFTFAPILMFALAILLPKIVYASETGAATTTNGLGLLAAGLCTGFATVGAGYAVGSVASSALGAVSEDPKILGKTLIFVGLAEGIAIYGLIISILILGRI